MLKDLIRTFSQAMRFLSPRNSHLTLSMILSSTVHGPQHPAPQFTSWVPIDWLHGSWASSCFPHIKTSCPVCLLSCTDHSQNVISCETKIRQLQSEGLHLLLQIHTMCTKAFELWFTICYWHFCCKPVKGGDLTQCMSHRGKTEMEWMSETEDKM